MELYGRRVEIEILKISELQADQPMPHGLNLKTRVGGHEGEKGKNPSNSNLTTTSESLVLTVTLKVKEREQEINLPNLKLWVIGALLNEGFELI
ncbi:unnamed protein product [Prunus armeniaca]|uniref:Uncharacterized protein n=1 Tax=Prunus armeniaca TaxID=36596 RepID=A0A6J5WJ92_PRUAR|nr:unnamed protein product [Prunus armeniaca]